MKLYPEESREHSSAFNDPCTRTRQGPYDTAQLSILLDLEPGLSWSYRPYYLLLAAQVSLQLYPDLMVFNSGFAGTVSPAGEVV